MLRRGSLRAVLVLENRLIHHAFTADRLDAVNLIAAQLTVSLDNAQLCAELTASRAGSPPPPTRPAGASSATSTTALSNGWPTWPSRRGWRRMPRHEGPGS